MRQRVVILEVAAGPLYVLILAASLVATAAERFGPIDIVVNNAGMVTPTPLAGVTDDEFTSGWARTVDVNLSAAALLVRTALPHILESDADRIVNSA